MAAVVSFSLYRCNYGTHLGVLFVLNVAVSVTVTTSCFCHPLITAVTLHVLHAIVSLSLSLSLIPPHTRYYIV